MARRRRCWPPLEDGAKACSRCHKSLRLADFAKNGCCTDGRATICKACVSASHKTEGYKVLRKKWRAAVPKEAKRVAARKCHLRRAYNMTVEQFEKLHREADGCCAICRVQCASGPDHGATMECSLVVDHCHDSGDVRGLLCGSCNVAIGLLKDSAPLAEAAVKYLKRHGMRVANGIDSWR